MPKKKLPLVYTTTAASNTPITRSSDVVMDLFLSPEVYLSAVVEVHHLFFGSHQFGPGFEARIAHCHHMIGFQFSGYT
ncbi:hypothetical protein ACFLX3_03075 [Chloroflexota bacterium]